MNLFQSDTYEVWINREYKEIQHMVRVILHYYGFDVDTHKDACTQYAAGIIDSRSLLARYDKTRGPDCWNYMMTCIKLPVLQRAEKEERLWPSVNPVCAPISQTEEDDEGLFHKTPEPLTWVDNHEALPIQEYLGYLSEMSDVRAAQMIASRMSGYTDAEIEQRYGYSHTLTKRFQEEAQVAYCQYTGMHIEPGPKQRVILPEAYKGEWNG